MRWLYRFANDAARRENEHLRSALSKSIRLARSYARQRDEERKAVKTQRDVTTQWRSIAYDRGQERDAARAELRAVREQGETK